jgi:DNA topoisomerase II
MNHALMQVVREMVMNCTDLVERDPDFRKITVSFDAASGGITIRNDGRGIPVGKDLIRIEDEARRATLGGLWSPTLLLARWGCSSNYDDSKARFTAGKNGLGAKAVLAWCDRVELRAVDCVRKRSFQQTWLNGMREESVPKVKENVSAKHGYTELKLWPAYSSLVRMELPLTEDQVGALRWCVWECSTVLPKVGPGGKFSVTIDGYTLPDHTAEGMVKEVALMVRTKMGGLRGGQGTGAGAGGASITSLGTTSLGTTSLGTTSLGTTSLGTTSLGLIREEVVWGEHKESITGFAFPTFGTPDPLLPLGFVNGVPCPKGTHRQRWESALLTDIRNKLGGGSGSGSGGTSSLTKGSIMNHLFLVTCARINQPKFASQTKDELVSRIPANVSMSGRINLSPLVRTGFLTFLKQLAKSSTDVAAQKLLAPVVNLQAASTRTRRRVDVEGIEHYEGAELAGRAPCLLFLTEGLSAQNCARNVIARLPQQTKARCGSFALRGKLINAMSNPAAKVWSNKEVQALVKICNLDPQCPYDTVAQRSSLRYEKLVLWTDADTDGGHIAWLVFVLIYNFWPRLAESGFLERFVTPLLKIHRPGVGEDMLQFYSEAARDRWFDKAMDSWVGGEGGICETGKSAALRIMGPGSHVVGIDLATEDMVRRAQDVMVTSRGARIKYYKGLGRLMDDDEKDLAGRFDDLRICIESTGQDDVDLVKAIGSDAPQARRDVQLERRIKALAYDDVDKISVCDFVDGELLPYMRDANMRQIPGIDGFVEVSRMIMAYFFVKPSAADPKAEHGVARLAAAIAAELDYHHGETSMAGAIATMAQDFAGKNNVNLLQPRGQFGTRAEPTPAAPRYTNTALHPLAAFLFPREDFSALPMPRNGEVPTVLPGVLPMILVNGASGIGYGHSTDIPSHHPLEVLAACRRWIAKNGRHVVATDPRRLDSVKVNGAADEAAAEAAAETAETAEVEVAAAVKPWVRGLGVQPVFNEETKEWESHGSFLVSESGTTLTITELPVGTWTKHYAQSVLPKCGEGWLSGIFMHPKISQVRIEADIVGPLPKTSSLLKTLKLVKRISYSNMKCFDRFGTMRSFATVEEMVEDFALLRIWIYLRRKAIQLTHLESALLVARGKLAFVRAQVEGSLDLRSFPSKAKVHEAIQAMGIPRDSNGSYAYLDSMSIWTLTEDEVASCLQKVRGLEAEIAQLKAMAPIDLWTKDLDKCEAKLKETWREGQNQDGLDLASKTLAKRVVSGTSRKRVRN